MPNYPYKCTHCGISFRDTKCVAERDNVNCDACGKQAERLFEGTTNVRYEHRSNEEKGIHRDLMEINKLEKESANNPVRVNDNCEQVRIEKEVRKLKFVD